MVIKNNMDYKLALELKEAGFSNKYTWATYINGSYLPRPTLDELIDACGNIQLRIWSYWVENDLQWQADNDPFCTDVPNMKSGLGSTPIEAVARLWISLKVIPTLTR